MIWRTMIARAATIPPLPRRRILRVGGADLYLDGALLGLGRTVHVDRLPAADADRAAARARDYDLVIFDGVTPSAAPQAGRFLYFDPQGPGSPFAAAREARAGAGSGARPGVAPPRSPAPAPARSRRRQHRRGAPAGARARRRRAGRLVRRPVDCRARAPRPAHRRAGLRPAPLGPADAPRVPAAGRQRARLGGPRRRRAPRPARPGRHRARRARVGHHARPHAGARRARAGAARSRPRDILARDSGAGR